MHPNKNCPVSLNHISFQLWLKFVVCAQNPPETSSAFKRKATKPEGWMRWAIKVDLPFLSSLDDDGWGLIGGAPWSFG